MFKILVGVAAALAMAGAAWSADQPRYAPAPDWLKPVGVPTRVADADGAALQTLLQNQQTRFGPDGEEIYSESAVKILSAEGLASSGNVILNWKPDTEELIIHKLEIIRGDRVIDALGAGRKVTVLRRETNLELAMLDGALTATLQPEGLQVGDVLHLAYTLRRHDPVYQGRSEGFIALSRPGRVGHAYFRTIWPTSKPVRWRATDGLDRTVKTTTASGDELVVDLTDTEAPKPPAGAPGRYADLATLEFSEFPDWKTLSATISPLYQKAAALAPDSPLRAQAAAIKAANPDVKDQAMAALRLVEDQTRYVFLGMNDGGYTPAAADLTWSRRFGDCKGKTVLLLALLDQLGVDAEPLLVSTESGDGLDQRLPTLEQFDHVIVQARIGGRTYWLDGTRLGDVRLDDLPTPEYHWGLPLTEAGADLERIDQPPYARPHFESIVRLDATAGLDKPAPAHVEHVLTGDEGLETRFNLTSSNSADAEQTLRDYWRKAIPWIEPKSVAFRFDEARDALVLSMDGMAAIDWAKGGGVRDFDVADSSLGYDVNYDREPGPHSDAPYAVGYPMYKKWTVTVLLPNHGDGFRLLNAADVDQTIAGVEFQRSSHMDHGTAVIEAVEKAVAPEFPATEAKTASASLRHLAEYDVVIRAEPATAAADSPELTAAREKLVSGANKLQNGDYDGALADARAVIASPGFASLTLRQRTAGYVIVAWAAYQTNDFKAAHAAAVQATDQTGAGDDLVGANLWIQRLRAADSDHDFDDAGLCLTKLAQSWPESLLAIPDQGVFQLVNQVTPHRRTDLLLALQKAHWRPKSAFRDSSDLWLKLTAALIDRGDLKAAAVTARDVTDDDVLIEMHADRRFDPIVQADPARYDVNAAIARGLTELQAKSAAAPDKLEGVVAVAQALMSRKRAAEALSLLDAALAKARPSPDQPPAFSDVEDQIGRALETRSGALLMLGRTDEAVKAQQRAAAHAEHGGSNVSQTLDLAGRLNGLGRPQDALDAIDEFDPTNASPFGLMVWQETQACAYAQLNDKGKLTTAMAYLHAHAKDGPRLVESAQLCADDADGVAKTIIDALHDPDTRAAALAGLQDYADSPGVTAWNLKLLERWKAVRSRPDVQAAIAKVGRIESYPIID
ncbi:MAG: DUF3857 domain-containing protein [Caulobacteraceae bacterium]|nr:DUF3857 domain-containing protein [Caulobacteraceae bacterium]